MTIRRGVLFVVFAALAVLAVLPVAASAEISPQWGLATWSGDASSPGPRLAGILELEGPQLSLGAVGVGGRIDRPWSGRLSARYLPALGIRHRLELRLEAGEETRPGLPANGGLRAEARIHAAGPTAGAWMAVAGERGTGRALAALGGGGALVGLGAWARARGAFVTLDLEQRAGLVEPLRMEVPFEPDTLGGPPTSPSPTLRTTLTTTRAALRWEGGRLAVETIAGVTFSVIREPRRWAQAGMVLQLTPALAAFASVGDRDAEHYVVAVPESPRTTVGIQLFQGRATADVPMVARAVAEAWEVRRVEDDLHRLRVWASGARLVEITGDFTDWRPLLLEPDSRGRWSVLVDLVPGVHHVNLRVDGGVWMPPPGVPTTTNGYNGTVGLLVVD